MKAARTLSVVFGLLMGLLFAVPPGAVHGEERAVSGGSSIPPSKNPSLEFYDTSYRGGDETIIEILTIEPGNFIHNIWGHTGIHVYDARIKKDMVFDYGLFRYGIDFGWRYLTGDPAYWLGIHEWDTTVKRFSGQNRAVYVQRLNFTEEQKNDFLEFIYKNALPKNRYYQYHHFLDNCTTRVRDVIDLTLKGRLKSEFAGKPVSITFRSESMDAASRFVTSYLLLNLLLNPGADVPIDRWKALFLPLLLMDAMELANIPSDFSDGRPLVEKAKFVYRSHPSPDQGGARGWSIFFGIGILYLGLFHLAPILLPEFSFMHVAGKIGIWSWSLLFGGIGSILAMLWIISPRDVFAWNLNLLAFHPFLLFWPLLWNRRINSRLRLYGLSTLVILPLLGLLLELTGLIPQMAHPFLLAALLLHSFHLSAYLWRLGPFVKNRGSSIL